MCSASPAVVLHAGPPDGRVYTNWRIDADLTYGPRSLDIHAFDERVHIESVRNITKTIALFTAEGAG